MGAPVGAGSVISVKDVQSSKARSWIAVRAAGSVISCKDMHSRKAFGPISVRVRSL